MGGDRLCLLASARLLAAGTILMPIFACLQHVSGNKFTVDGAGPFALDLLRGVSYLD
jgi:hypothetical protein